MHTQIRPKLLNQVQQARAETILRRCVHCGFCNATCPTYQLLGDERDGPRGRIYLIKQLLEGGPAAGARNHLDRCLTCLGCESTCPSGVDYGELLAIGRGIAAKVSRRPLMQQILRRLLLTVLPERKRFKALYRFVCSLRFCLPRRWRKRFLPLYPIRTLSSNRHSRRVILLQGCVQDTLDARINADTSFVLDQLGVQPLLAREEGCCGALEQHLDAEQAAIERMKRNIDAWWPLLEAGAEAIISNASACGLMVTQYGEYLAADSDYAEKARIVAGKCLDILTFLRQQSLPPLTVGANKIAVHEPCTLQHGQKRSGQLTEYLTELGFHRVDFAESHLCCGSAGAYSLFQPALSDQLLRRKLENLLRHEPDLIVSANIGCLLHLQQGTVTPVKHWISLLADSIAGSFSEV